MSTTLTAESAISARAPALSPHMRAGECVAVLSFLYLSPLSWIGGRERVHTFLFALLLGTFAAYSLLPLFPIHGPQVVYPALDLPNINGFWRSLNLWVLDPLDNPASVFPSGYMAVGFSMALGMYRAFRPRPAIWGGAFLFVAVHEIAVRRGEPVA